MVLLGMKGKLVFYIERDDLIQILHGLVYLQKEAKTPNGISSLHLRSNVPVCLSYTTTMLPAEKKPAEYKSSHRTTL